LVSKALSEAGSQAEGIAILEPRIFNVRVEVCFRDPCGFFMNGLINVAKEVEETGVWGR